MLGTQELSARTHVPNPKARLIGLSAVVHLAHEPGLRRSTGVPELYSALAESVAPEELSAGIVDRLARNSITTVEELLGLAHVDRRFDTSFLAELGVSPEAVESLRDGYGQTDIGRAELRDWERFDQYEYALGFEWRETEEPEAGEQEVGASASSAPTGGVNLATACMAPIRDQQDRGTCTAFASVACLEHHLCRTVGNTERLSEQFQYWNMVEQTGRHSLVACFPLLRSDGVCRGSTWPYYGKGITGNDGQGPPPSSALAEAAAYRCSEVLQLPPRSVPAIQQALRDDHVVAVGFPVYKSWFDNPTVRKYGNITLPLPGEVPDDLGHAVALVGFNEDDDFAGGGFFIVRNSWNHVWGTSSVFGSGYGTIPYAYIQRLNWDAWCITR